MKLIFLGTGTAGPKFTPEDMIEPNQRRCASLFLDSNVVVDIGMQSFDYATKLGIDTANVTDVFLSHMHPDHYAKSTLLSYASVALQKINVWCYKGSVDKLQLTDEERESVNICPVDFMDVWETAGMRVTALPANHAWGNALHYIFEKEGKTLFYGLDGAWFTPREWRHLHACEAFDAMILDCTNMSHDPINFLNAGEHNNLMLLPVVIRTLKEAGVAGDKTLLIADHIGSRVNNERVDKVLRDMGLLPAYDGFEIVI